MSDEKIDKKVVDQPVDLRKQVDNIAYTVRKMKDKLKEQFGMDIDGDGHVGNGPYKKALIFLLIAGMASFCMAEDQTAIAYWSSSATVNSSGKFAGDGVSLTNVVASGLSLASNKILIGSSTGVGSAQTLSGDIAITTNGAATIATIGGTLTVTGVTTLVSTPVLRNGLTVQTNATVGGTLSVTGVASFTVESVHNGGIDADYITTDAGLGVDAKTAGKLAVGTNTATSIDYGSASVTAHTFLSDGTGTGEVVLPNESIGDAEIAAVSAAKLSAGTVASAIDGNAITNLDASDLLTGTVPNARLDADLQPLAGDDGGGLTNIVSGGIVSLDAAKLQAATVATAIDGSAITNLNGANIASGDIASARLTANAVVVTDFGAANQVLVGSGSGTFAATTGSGAIVVTNVGVGSTNTMYFSAGGILASNVYTGP